VSYLARGDLAHVDTSDFSNTALGKGINEGKAIPFSRGLTRGASPLKVVSGISGSGSEPKGFGGGNTNTNAPARSAPTASSATNVRAISTGATVTALKPLSSEAAEPATAFKRDYEERAKEFLDEVAEQETSPETALFTDAAAKEAADAKALAAERRQQSMMQGYTGNSCSECQNFTMVRNGTCEKCDTCGSTSGCS